MNKDINKNEESRALRSNPISKGVDSSIAMGIEATEAPLPLRFNTETDNDNE